MPDALAASALILQRLVKQVMKERDPVKYDQLAAEIRRVLEEREHSREALERSEGPPGNELVVGASTATSNGLVYVFPFPATQSN
jgi:hypothetical protein